MRPCALLALPLLVSTAGCDAASLEVLQQPDAGLVDALEEQPVGDEAGAEAAGCDACLPALGCLGTGEACSFAGACCSLACVAPDGTAGTCGDRPECAGVGAPCTHSEDCCSNVCSGTTCMKAAGPPCLPAGEPCMGGPQCCGGVCGAGADGTSRCALLAACRVQGEVCASGHDCCSGACMQGRCAPSPMCNTGDTKACKSAVWEACAMNADCCSRSCQGGRCRPVGGCAPLCERCSGNADCCSGSCLLDPDGVMRCKASGCTGAGEVCSATTQCCNGGGLQCVTDPTTFVMRCEGSSSCAASGSCAVGRDCCGAVCLGQCSSKVGNGSRCTTKTDCLDPAADCYEIDGGLTCAP